MWFRKKNCVSLIFFQPKTCKLLHNVYNTKEFIRLFVMRVLFRKNVQVMYQYNFLCCLDFSNEQFHGVRTYLFPSNVNRKQNCNDFVYPINVYKLYSKALASIVDASLEIRNSCPKYKLTTIINSNIFASNLKKEECKLL